MPRRTDIETVLLIGSGPIVIGQACEFDYSGTQACKALREEGYRVVLVNSNPATIMTDPGTADRTYVEPITPEYVAEIVRRERPDALLPTLGGQTGLNTALAVEEMGVLAECGVEMIGADRDVIKKAEDRELFRAAMTKIGLDLPKSRRVNSLAEAREALEELGLPCICRASFTLGGAGGGIAYNRDEFESIVATGLKLSPVREVMLDESILGWKEYEMEVMRDKNDNCVIVCAIENFDPMGVHTGDSITVAPAQTLSDKEYHRMRDATLACMREIGVETGGSNVQFAVNPRTGRMTVIEMNPRVSRSSALASKATGFPIAKIAAKLAVGYTLDELPNDITRETKACFEPSIDYVVTKIPRWTFEKFPEADPTLTIQMKSVGETMAIGRTFKESFQKALRGTETGHFGLGGGKQDLWDTPDRPTGAQIVAGLATPNERRVSFLRYAFKSGMTLERVRELTNIDPWFLDQILHLTEIEAEIRAVGSLNKATAENLRRFKRAGFGDLQLAYWWDATESAVRAKRKELGVEAVFKQVDTCAAEFEAVTPYYYSTYETEDESPGPPPSSLPTPHSPQKSPLKRVMILGGGPNRIGQGIEFDYCCCQAAYALEELGVESVMVNSNPETVSTDYDTSDLLFFEPLTTEDVLNVVDRLKPDGVIVQFGGQTPLNLARGLEAAGVPIIGTSPEMIDAAEDRDRFAAILEKTGLRQPPNGTATDAAGARRIAERIGYPVLVRPSYVLGGRAMEICYDGPALSQYMTTAVDAAPDRPILIDRFLEDAIEVDVDCVADFGLFPASPPPSRRLRRRGHRGRGGRDGAHRGGRGSQRRFGLLPPPPQPAGVGRGGDRGGDGQAGEGVERLRADERAVRGEERAPRWRPPRRCVHRLRPRGQPPRLPHGPVRLQGDGGAVGEDRGEGDGGGEPRGAGGDGGDRAGVFEREGERVPVQPVQRGGHRLGAGDAVHRRGDGDRGPVPGGVRQKPDRRRQSPADGVSENRRGRSSSAWPRAAKRRWSSRRSGWNDWGTRSSPPPAPPRRCGRPG